MADSDEELEPFQMTGEEFIPRKRRFTKEDRIYGMWAEHDSDDEYSRQKDYTRPVNFVSSGRTGEEGDGTGDEDSDYGEEELDEEAKRILEQLEQQKLDRGGQKAGIGKFTHASLEKNKKLSMFKTQEQKINDDKKTSSSLKSSLKKKKQTLFSQSKPMDKDFGRWERYTTGFGSKMLSKMGWKQGTGLGSGGEGIVNPVRATSHKEFGKGLAHMQVSKPTESLVDVSDSDEEQKDTEESHQWRRGKGPAKPKYIYKTVEELMESSEPYHSRSGKSRGGGGGVGQSSVKVIDMTGPQKRVLSSYEEMHESHALPDQMAQKGTEQKLFLSELLYNVNLLVEKTEHDIMETDRKLKYNRDLIVNLQHEKEERELQREDEEKQIEKLTEILNTVEVFEKRLKCEDQTPLTLTECEDLMIDLQKEYPVEYAAYNLSSVAVAIVFPLIKKHLDDWDMLASPSEPVGVFQRWKSLLREQKSDHTMPSSENMDPYDRLVWEVWMPKFRKLILSWSPRVCNPIVDLLECWRPLLPYWVLENILDQLVLPKLQTEQENWDPTTDIVPIHKWIHPWLPLMNKKLEVLYPSIRYKMASALANWHPSDKSAHKILEPWVQVFTPQVMETFVVRTILPKLVTSLQMELRINPHKQNIAPFEWVRAWRDMVGPANYASILETNFFPKWIQVLSSWLANNPNFDEVTRWFSGWKSMFDVEVLRQPSVKFYFDHALVMMNEAVAGTFQPGARENVAYFISMEKRRQQPSQKVAPTLLRELVEKKAEELGIIFMPVPGHKQHDGKPLYNFGRATVYMERQVLFVMNSPGQFRPISLDDLLRLA